MMKQIFRRGAVFLTTLALALSLSPWALAQSAETEEVPLSAAPQPVVLTQSGQYSEGFIRVTDGTLWGYADSAGKVVIQPQFEQASDFFLGCAQVVRNGKAGLLSWNGAFLLQPEYDELTHVGYGVYLGKRGEVWDVLSITASDSSHLLYTDLSSAILTSGTVQSLVLRDQEGKVTRISASSLPQLLASHKMRGWQFPLSASRRASFQDVSSRDWYARWVNLAYNVGLMEGTGNGNFEPVRTLTVAEALRLAACMESRALQDDFHLQSVSGALWYSSSVAYCEASGIISSGQFTSSDYSRPITRAEMARIFAAVTPVRSMETINSLSRVKETVPDVQSGDFAADAIYSLYAKGVLNGTDSALSFRPSDNLTRAEAAAIVSRIARPEQRITLW